jgi:hypothetical protein
MNTQEQEFFTFKVIQSGEIIKVQLSPSNLKKNFQEIFHSLLKDIKLKQRDVFLSNEEGKMIGLYDLRLNLEEIIKKFGTQLKVYSEKII